jgi:hypothetical protein
MPRTCTLSYRINNGALTDIATHGFHLVKSDDRIIAPIKDYEIQEYPEYSAAEIYPYASEKPFDYTVKLLAFGDEASVNASVRTFWDSLFANSGSSMSRMAYPITLINYWKGMQVTGYAKSADTDKYYPELIEYESSAYIFDIVFFINDPTTLMPIQ